MRHLLRPLALLALLSTGCERRPEDPIFVHGRLKHLDGSPSVDTPLTLERKVHLRAGNVDPAAEGPFEPYLESRSGRGGDFTLEVLYGDAIDERSSDFVQYRFRVTAPLEDGHGVFSSFVFYDDAELPTLRPWAPHLALTQGAEGPELSFDAAPPPPPLPPSAKLPEIYYPDSGPKYIEPLTPHPVVQLHGPGGRVWEAHDPASPWRPHPYLLEDFPGVEAQVRAVTLGSWNFYPLAANSSNVSYRVEWRGPRLPVPTGTLRPVSRGTSCGPSPTGAPCPYTDGSLLLVRTAPEHDNTGVSDVTLEWETPIRPRRAVIRDLQVLEGYAPVMNLRVEGSLDGADWSTLAEVPYRNFDPEDPHGPVFFTAIESTEADSPYGDGPLDVLRKARFLDVPLSGDAPARLVRLQVKSEDGSSALFIYALSELSVFE